MKTIVVHVAKCLHCGSCELACALSHSDKSTLVEALDTSPLRRIRLRPYGATFAPIACRHCLDAPCVYACIAGARQRTTDGIQTAEHECVGCGSCYMVCPIGAITRQTPTGRYASCDRCGDGQPHCVQACPTSALVAIEAASEQSAFFLPIDQRSEVQQ